MLAEGSTLVSPPCIKQAGLFRSIIRHTEEHILFSMTTFCLLYPSLSTLPSLSSPPFPLVSSLPSPSLSTLLTQNTPRCSLCPEPSCMPMVAFVLQLYFTRSCCEASSEHRCPSLMSPQLVYHLVTTCLVAIRLNCHDCF